MNIIQDNIAQIKQNFATNKPMVVKPTVLGNALMRPPSNAVNNYITPSTSRSRPDNGCQSSTSRSKSTPTTHRDTYVIVSICEGRGKASGTVGIAAIDIHRPVLILSEISDTQTYIATLTKLNILRPTEVLVPSTFVEGAAPSRLITVIMNQFPNLSVTSVSRSEFNRSRGLYLIQNLCAEVFNSVVFQVKQKFYTPAASCALLRYVEQSRRVLYSPKTIKVIYQEPENTIAIDIDTAEFLELVTPAGKQNVSLFTVLNYCSTISGKKLLRSNILQPPCKQNVIETRQDCVQELLENPTLLTRLQETLKPLSDIEASLTFGTVVPATASSVSERQLNYTLQLKGLLNAVQPLANELKATKHPVFRDIYYRIEGQDTRQKILTLISEIINEDAHLGKGQAGELQRCFAIKSGINGFLDLSRRLYTEGVDNMRSYVDELSESCNLPLRVQHTIKNGFHIILPLTKALRNMKKTDLPPIFTKSERLTTHFYLTTMDMINFDKRLKNNSAEIQNISNVIIYKLLVDIRPHIGDLYQLCDDVAQLDMLVSLARASSVSNWVRPRLVDTHLNLEGARHPILEHVADQDPVANTIYAYPRCSLHIITGPNMSGKSILLQTLCLLQVLSQLGCYVPCSRATFRIADKIYARVAEDDNDLTASSFALEMTKMSYLLSTLSDKSLVVLDELCKTTSCDEGVAMAMAICEKMMKRGCFVFVATHFIPMTVLADMYPNVVNWHLETLEELRANNTRISLNYTHRLLPGVTSIDSYGIKLSRIINCSQSVSDRAEDLYKYLKHLRKFLSSESTSNKPEFLKFKLQAELDLLKIRNQLTDEIQKDKIANFQNKTGLSFEPSPLTIEKSNSLLNQSSDKKTSTSNSKDKKLSTDSNSWIPTPSTKSAISSNHQFSVPVSNKSSSNQNQEKITNKHIFSCDNNDIIQHMDEPNLLSGENNRTIEKSNSLLNQLSDKKTSTSNSKDKKLNTDSNSWIPTPSTKSAKSSNHQFSVPVSNQSSSNQNQEKAISKLVFSCDNNDIIQQVEEQNLLSGENNIICPDSTLKNTESITFSASDHEISSIHKNQYDFTLTASNKNKNWLFNNSPNTQSQNITFSKYQDFKLICTNAPNIERKLFEETNLSSAENTFNNASSAKLNLIVNSTHSNKEISSSNPQEINTDDEVLSSQSTCWSSAENTLKDNNPNKLNLIVQSTPSIKENSLTNINNNSIKEIFESSKNTSINTGEGNSAQKSITPSIITIDTDSSILSKMPLTASMFNVSSPVLGRKFQKNQGAITKQIPETQTSTLASVRLVSNLYDTDSDSSSDNEECDESMINGNHPTEMFSLDELNFETYLNLRQGITSTPIETNKSSEYYTANTIAESSILPPNTFVFNESDLSSNKSPVIKRNSTSLKQKFNKIVPEKIPKLDESPNLQITSSFISCSSNSNKDLSKCSTTVVIGQNK